MNPASLKHSLALWTGFPSAGQFEPILTRKAAKQVEKQVGDACPRKPAPYDLHLVYQRLSRAWGRDRSIRRIAARDLRRLPWVLFYPPGNVHRYRDRADWLGNDSQLVKQFGRWLCGGYRPRSILSLLHEFLRVYPVQLETFDDIRRLLNKTIGANSSDRVSLRRWKLRCRAFPLLRVDGCLLFVDNLLSAPDEPDDILNQAGLDSGLERCGFLKSGVRSYLQKARTLLDVNRLKPERLTRLLALLESNGELRFDERVMRGAIAEALLGPFADRHNQSGTETNLQALPVLPSRSGRKGTAEIGTKKLLQPFFLRHYGDPRLQSGKQKWAGVPDNIRRVLIRWLVKSTLEQFFALVKETALDRHWRYREAFWRGFLNRDLIDEIWFVLGPRAKLYLRSHLRRRNRDGGEADTAADLRNAQRDQSVLLLRMPGLTIAEWSHNGSCRFWLDRTAGAPELYRHSYSRSDLTRWADYAQPHLGSPTGIWQDKIAEWLRRNTGIKIDREEYFPVGLQESRVPSIWHRPS